MKPVGILKRWSRAGARPQTRPASRRRPPSSARRPAELMTIASLIEAEGRGDDMPKISRVIYNRLDGPGDKGGTNGRSDRRIVAYGLGLWPGSTELTTEQLAEDTPYNTYQRPVSRRPRSRRRVTTPSPQRPTRPTATGTTTSRSTSRRARPSSPRTYDGFLEGYKDEYKAYCTPPTHAESDPEPADVSGGSGRRCGVLGDPIAHSLSPVLHRAGTPSSDWTGPTTPTGSAPAGCAEFLVGTGRGRGAGCR